MAQRKLGLPLRVLLLGVGCTGILAWLPLLRSVMDGDSYAGARRSGESSSATNGRAAA